MDKDRITGSAEEYAGKVGNTVGSMTGDKKAQAEGLARQAKGSAQELYGPGRSTKAAVTPSATARKSSLRRSRKTRSAPWCSPAWLALGLPCC